jgi:hypothetical protein
VFSIVEEQDMADRQATVVCTFEPTSPRITAYDIHEWIYEELRIPEDQLRVIQIDGTKKQVFLKLIDDNSVQTLLTKTQGQVFCKHTNGERSLVTEEQAGLGKKKIRVANLPPEINNEVLSGALSPYGKVTDVYNEKWSNAYRYAVDNGIRQVTIHLKRHVPSHLTIAGQRVLLSYEGQLATCYGCGETGHLYLGCPRWYLKQIGRAQQQQTTYASVLTDTNKTTKEDKQYRERGREQEYAISETNRPTWAELMQVEEQPVEEEKGGGQGGAKTTEQQQAPRENAGTLIDIIT